MFEVVKAAMGRRVSLTTADPYNRGDRTPQYVGTIDGMLYGLEATKDETWMLTLSARGEHFFVRLPDIVSLTIFAD